MSNLKDTDIDDLLRRASDDYPLRTDTADWDRMAAALEKAPPPTDGEDIDDKRKRRRFFWLFLLLPLGMLGYYTWHGRGQSAITASNKPAATTPAAGTAANAASGEKGTTANPTSGQTGAVSTGTTASTASSQTGAASGGVATSEASGATGAPSADVATNRVGTVPAGAARTTGTSTVATGGPARAGGSATAGNTTTAGKSTAGGTTGSGSAADGRSAAAGGRTTDDAIGFVPDNKLSLSAANQAGNTGSDRIFFDLQRATISNDYHLSVDVKAPAAKKDSSAKQKTSAKTKTPHLYAGLIFAPDLSTVKMQSIKGVGTTYGLLLGYAFNKRWSIESGVNVDRKRYYTDGEYFNTKSVNLPPYSKLTSVDGTCYMWEIPLNIRYNFNPGAKTSWFATAGFSTYLMTHEKYTYGYKWQNNPAVWDSSWNLKRPSQYPFSIINLSAGFEQRLGKIGNLRVEPYVRIPLTGMGTGKLPIMSTGVNIGITRQLWK